MKLPTILLTPGDVAGIGPEIIVRAWPELTRMARPIVIGDVASLCRAAAMCRIDGQIAAIKTVDEAQPRERLIPVIQASNQDLRSVAIGTVDARAGRAAYDFLCVAIDKTLNGEADAIVTCPLHKEGLRRAGLNYPGHTEILAERTGAKRHAMVLWGGEIAVAHVTLHMALRDTFAQMTSHSIGEKITLLSQLLPKLRHGSPRIGVAALNPHAGDGGLFGDEEARLLAPAVESARRDGIDASGPWPADTLFVRALRGEFDGVVAMYHDQGHIPMKLHCGWELVNITAGLPIIRTSVAHGTAYDIAGQGKADCRSLIAATDAACRIVSYSRENQR